MPNLPVKILIVDDHPLVRHGIRSLLETQVSFRVMAEAGNAKEAAGLLEKTAIDLVLLDINMPGTDGIELASRLRARYPWLFIIMLTIHDGDAYIRRAMAAGANGYVIKDAEPQYIFNAIHKVANKITVIPDDFRPETLLTSVERRVLWLTGHREYDTARIAASMGIVEATVNTHRHNIWQKLKSVLPKEQTSNPNLLVILGVEYRQRCPEYPSE
ncbi:LuxR family two component transcriptional regulator [Nitrosospira multiformis]|uniref:LuxR family two component transcriptional regulator n=1 Tax=Nitrosospira multiformis TaxID=1231 RepID=A0A2T5IGT8_9PROT|nr:response regulator transcription factor [Nitrosospira multiformis]PTQ83009.1 LuxR family two component transcriptional regulator [Nitrosospira multiformis]